MMPPEFYVVPRLHELPESRRAEFAGRGRCRDCGAKVAFDPGFRSIAGAAESPLVCMTCARVTPGR